MEPILVDDTRSKCTSPYGLDFSHELESISRYRTTRTFTTWRENLRVLVYDGDEDVEEEDEEREEKAEHEQEEQCKGDVNDISKPKSSGSDSGDNETELERTIASSFQQSMRLRLQHLNAILPDKGPFQRGDSKTHESETAKMHQSHSGVEDDSEDEATLLDRAIALSLTESETEPSQGEVSKSHKSSTPGKHQCCSSAEEDSEDEATLLDRAIALSLTEESHGKEKARTPPTNGKLSGELEQFGVPFLRTWPNMRHTTKRRFGDTCNNCLKYPRFPKSRRADRFRVVHLSSEGLQNLPCFHYMAVSYCWNVDRDNKKTYQVRFVEKDGTVVERRNRAPDEVIDRAVEFARNFDVRLIWLDQECLPQDSSPEQELGIQAMDMVYQLAYWSVGLFETVISSQSHLDSVMSVVDWARPQSEGQLRFVKGSELTIQGIIKGLTEFLEILARDSWNQRAWIVQEWLCSTNHMILTIRTAGSLFFKVPGFTRQTEGENIHMLVSDLQTLVKASQDFFDCSVEHGLLTHPNENPHIRQFQALESLRALFPDIVKTNNPLASMHVIGAGNFGPRRSCNAATALSFLKHRFNSRPADRLAILANMCNYETRLDTVAIENNFGSLATCIFALAILNGDLSLLVPDVYRVREIGIKNPSWALPIHHVLPFVDTRHQRDGAEATVRIPSLYSFVDGNLVMPAYVWTVNRPIDLSFVRHRCWKAYYSVTPPRLYVDTIEGEEEHAYEERWKKAVEVLGPDSKSFTQDMADQLPIGCRVRRELSIELLERHPIARAVVGKILFEILMNLVIIGERAAANSIWHSIRADCHSTKGEQRTELNELPDNVEDILADEKLPKNPWETLQLCHQSDGSVNETWLINRVMNDGVIWVGNYTRPERQEKKSRQSTGQEGIVMDQSILKRQLLLKNILFSSQRRLADEHTEQLFSSLFGIQLSSLWSSESAVRLVEMASATGDDGTTKLEDRVSVFDVDGPCAVVTPYDRDMEWLPRSPVRSMDVCWTVEPIGAPQKGTGVARIQVGGQVAGWDGTHKAPEAADKGKGRAETVGKGKDPDKVEAPSDGRFRVLGRVKGMWEIMMIPDEKYEFV